MADDSSATSPAQERKGAAKKEAASGEKPAASWLVPVVTALVLAAAFFLYYLVYVAAQREYLANRNFRSLAVLGDQIQGMISTHGSILEFYADLSESKKSSLRDKEDPRKFLVVRPEDKLLPREDQEKEARKDYLKYLAPGFELTELKLTVASQQKPPRLQVRRHNGHWELVLAAHRHPGAAKDYTGSLNVETVMRPLVGSLPFDDILLVSEKGTIVYQSNKAGPQFTTLTGLLQAQPEGAETKPGSAAAEPHTELASGKENRETGTTNIHQNADQTWRNKSKHLTDVVLAGTRSKLFLQPVLVDIFSDAPDADEPAREWVLCGLRSSGALQWEALSISSTFIIWFTAVFLAICMSGPILKILFMNQRERLRLRELGFLGMFLVLLTSVFTLSALEAAGSPLNDDTERQLDRLSAKFSTNVHDELRQMRAQLKSWCKSKDLETDLKSAEDREVIRSSETKTAPPPATDYPFLGNAFWTDDDGHQIVKWSTSSYVTPMINVSPLRIGTHPKSIYLDGKLPPFYFDSVLPPNKLQSLAVLTISTEDCNPDLLAVDDKGEPIIRGDVTGGSAFLSAQPLSLIDPIMPFGYGFALLDETGAVLFHSDKTKNLHENFLQESDWSRKLYAAAFGHSTQRSLQVKYLGKDYRARVTPISGVSQAPWSLIVYRDLSSVRTLKLQAMTMASTLLLMILAAPVLAVTIWCLIRRPRFAPEWLWPNQARMQTYLHQIPIYTFLIILFLILGFTGSVEQNVIACAAFPCAALLLTVWCIRAYPPTGKKPPTRRFEGLQVSPAITSMLGAIAFLLSTGWRRADLQSFTFMGFGTITPPLLDAPRRYLAMKWKRSFRTGATAEQSSAYPDPGSRPWRKYYVLSIVLLLLLLGVLIPMALFRASLTVERRLGIKQAQLHLASALGQRLISIKQLCDNGELSKAACTEFKKFKKDPNGPKDQALVWPKIVFDPLLPPDGELPVERHSSLKGGELYGGWFQTLVYALHHDYNKAAAEMLGVIPDRFNPPDGGFPDWEWENRGSDMVLRWHGVHLPAPGSNEVEDDLLITSNPTGSTWRDLLAGTAVATGVTLVIGVLVWGLARRVFLFHIDPLKITGARKAVECIREGRNVLVLVPPISDWQVEGQKATLDVREMAIAPKWAEALDLDTLPLSTVIEIRHFEYSSNDSEIDNQKSILLDRLLKRESTQVAVIMTVPVSSQDYRRMFPALEVVDLREEPFYWLKQYEGPGRDLIWNECGPMPALWPIGAQLAKDIKMDDSHSEETIASEILERADPYYRLVWKERSTDQKFVLAQLAEDGLINPTNSRAIRQMVRRGLITADPQFRIVNESFRRFLRSHASADLKRQWQNDSRRSGWGKLHGAFFTTMLLLGVFLLTTQNELWQSSAAYVTTALGALGTLSKLWNTYRGGISGNSEKAG